MQDFLTELRWRGMLHDMIPETEKQLQKEMTSAYIGFDPTASSLHIGNLATIMLLVHLQRAGHKPYALIGGATGMIGDPSGKSEERKFLSEETLRANQEAIGKQLQKFLIFEGKNAAEVVNNYDWFKEFGFLDFLRQVGKQITVNYMMAKDSVKNRLQEGSGLSFTEFSYQLLQGYDFYWLYKNKGIRLQMGGSDQWGNITTGTELIRKIEGGEAYALTTPLLTKSDGTKFGKSESGNVWLDASLTSPYKFYQFFINQDDADIPQLLRVFSLKGQQEIESLITEHQAAPHLRLLQTTLAEELTERIHSATDLANAKKASQILFGKDVVEELQTLDETTLLEVFEGIPQFEITGSMLSETKNIIDLLAEATSVFKSKGEARKAIQNNAVSINKIKIDSADKLPTDFELLLGKYLLAQNGKKHYYLIKVVG